MTCKDCKKWKQCKSSAKSDKYEEDGDSWANWCDDFDTIHKGKSISKGRYTITQSGYTWHLMIVDEQTGHMMLHAQCRKEMSEEELEAYLDRFIQTEPPTLGGMEGLANDPQQ